MILRKCEQGTCLNNAAWRRPVQEVMRSTDAACDECKERLAQQDYPVLGWEAIPDVKEPKP